MPLILNIDSATENASVAITRDGELMALKENPVQKEHSSFVHTAIEEITIQAGLSLKQLDAIAITSGPGSYTGLRVSMAAAKGLCYALNKPLIAVNTLQVMALAAIGVIKGLNLPYSDETMLVPMIDARRMEVFAAAYRIDLQEVIQTAPIVLTDEVLNMWSKYKSAYFFGSGSDKILNIDENFNGCLNVVFNAEHLGQIAENLFKTDDFADTAYLQPSYFKEFYNTAQIR